MAIDAINRNNNTVTSAVRQSAENRPSQEIKQAETQEAKAREISQRKAEEAPKPVVNALGQTTGTLINIVA